MTDTTFSVGISPETLRCTNLGTRRVGDAVTVMPLVWDGTCPACRAGHRHICQHLSFVGIDEIMAHGRRAVAAGAEMIFILPGSIYLRLAKRGITVARRTVTKYRKAMRIPSSRQRRDWKLVKTPAAGTNGEHPPHDGDESSERLAGRGPRPGQPILAPAAGPRPRFLGCPSPPPCPLWSRPGPRITRW